MVLMKSGEHLKIGQKAPNFSLTGADNKIYTLDDFSEANALVVIFMCNHCPYVIAKISAMNSLYNTYRPRKVEFVGINSNNNPSYPEDSFENMQEFAKKSNIRFPYLFDGSQKVAKDYGAVCTPDPFVFDASMSLAYHGRFDDATSPDKQPTTSDLADALDDILVGKLVRKNFLPSMGCSIKWRE
ncbi:MAG: thioredoxin family protein [Candidatus Micrarchaeota archaeon]